MDADDIGGRLRHARERRNLSLRDAASQTKLTIGVLSAIERNDFDRLPAGMYRKAYIRTFAAAVGLDPAEIAAEYASRFEPPPDSSPPDARPDAELHNHLVRQLAAPSKPSVFSVAGLVGLAAAWFMFSQALVTPALPPAGLPLEAASPVTVDVLPDAFQPAVVAVQPSAVPLRIEVSASDWCWVAAEADGRRVIYRLLEGGERVTLEAENAISLRLGNAGAVTLSLNDGAPHSPGARGEVVELEVTSDDLEGFDAAGLNAT
jgi:transcriptional regulator with XRE-family HTH domain